MPPREKSQKFLSQYRNFSFAETGPNDFSFDEDDIMASILTQKPGGDPRNLTPDLMAKLRRKRLREMTTEKFLNEGSSSEAETEEQQSIIIQQKQQTIAVKPKQTKVASNQQSEYGAGDLSSSRGVFTPY